VSHHPPASTTATSPPSQFSPPMSIIRLLLLCFSLLPLLGVFFVFLGPYVCHGVFTLFLNVFQHAPSVFPSKCVGTKVYSGLPPARQSCFFPSIFGFFNSSHLCPFSPALSQIPPFFFPQSGVCKSRDPYFELALPFLNLKFPAFPPPTSSFFLAVIRPSCPISLSFQSNFPLKRCRNTFFSAFRQFPPPASLVQTFLFFFSARLFPPASRFSSLRPMVRNGACSSQIPIGWGR